MKYYTQFNVVGIIYSKPLFCGIRKKNNLDDSMERIRVFFFVAQVQLVVWIHLNMIGNRQIWNPWISQSPKGKATRFPTTMAFRGEIFLLRENFPAIWTCFVQFLWPLSLSEKQIKQPGLDVATSRMEKKRIERYLKEAEWKWIISSYMITIFQPWSFKSSVKLGWTLKYSMPSFLITTDK